MLMNANFGGCSSRPCSAFFGLRSLYVWLHSLPAPLSSLSASRASVYAVRAPAVARTQYSCWLLLQRAALSRSRPQQLLLQRRSAAACTHSPRRPTQQHRRAAVAAAAAADDAPDVIVVTGSPDRYGDLDVEDVHAASGPMRVRVDGEVHIRTDDDGGIALVAVHGSAQELMVLPASNVKQQPDRIIGLFDRLDGSSVRPVRFGGHEKRAASRSSWRGKSMEHAFDAALEASDISEGKIVEGRMNKIKKWGVYVQLDCGVLGTLHISQISHLSIERGNVGGVLERGQRVKAMVLEVDVERGRCKLSTKALEQHPGDMLRDQQAVFDGAEAAAAAWRAGRA